MYWEKHNAVELCQYRIHLENQTLILDGNKYSYLITLMKQLVGTRHRFSLHNQKVLHKCRFHTCCSTAQGFYIKIRHLVSPEPDQLHKFGETFISLFLAQILTDMVIFITLGEMYCNRACLSAVVTHSPPTSEVCGSTVCTNNFYPPCYLHPISSNFWC